MTPEVWAALISAAGVVVAAGVAKWLSRKSGRVSVEAVSARVRDDLIDQLQEERNRQDGRITSLEAKGEVQAKTIAALEVQLRECYESAAKDRAKYLRELAQLRGEVRHYDGEVVALRAGILNGTIPPLPERPVWMGRSA